MRRTHCHRIIHVPRRFVAEEWGGTETVILEVARRQQRAGAQPEILTSMALAARRTEEIGGVPVRRYGHIYPYLGLTPADRTALDKKGGNLVSLPLMASLLKAPDVRLFHAHAIKRLGGMVRTAARLRRKPYVVTLHGGVFDVPQEEREELLKPVANRPEWGQAVGALLGSRRVLEDADHVICVGYGEFEKASDHLGHDRVSYLPNGVDTAKFATGDGGGFRRKHRIPPDALLVLNVSRIDAQKNQLLLLEAFLEVRRERPDAVLMLMGPETQPAYASRLRQFIADHHLEAGVRMLPGLRNDDPDLVNAYHACDVFVLPSVHEPFGIVVLEAWAAGRPVIANHVGGLRGLVRHGENGLFIREEGGGTAAELADRIVSLARSPGRRCELGEAGRKAATSTYDWSGVVTRLEGIYQAAEAHAARRGNGRPS